MIGARQAWRELRRLRKRRDDARNWGDRDVVRECDLALAVLSEQHPKVTERISP